VCTWRIRSTLLLTVVSLLQSASVWTIIMVVLVTKVLVLWAHVYGTVCHYACKRTLAVNSLSDFWKYFYLVLTHSRPIVTICSQCLRNILTYWVANWDIFLLQHTVCVHCFVGDSDRQCSCMRCWTATITTRQNRLTEWLVYTSSHSALLCLGCCQSFGASGADCGQYSGVYTCQCSAHILQCCTCRVSVPQRHDVLQVVLWHLWRLVLYCRMICTVLRSHFMYDNSTKEMAPVTTAAAPAREVETVVRSPTNMAATKIVAIDFNKMTSLDRPACGHVRWEDLLANWWLETLLLFWLDVRRVENI